MTVVRYPLAELEQAYPPMEGASDRARIEVGDVALLTPDDLHLGPQSSLRFEIEHEAGPDGDRSAHVLRTTGDLARAGYSDDVILGIILNPDNAVSEHIHAQEYPDRAARRAVERVRGDMARDGQGDGAGRGAGSEAGEAGGNAQRPTLPFLDPAELAAKDVPPRQFAIHGLFLSSSLAALTGPGAAGKSLLMQQAAIAVAVGGPFLGLKTEQGNAGYLTAEDDARELHDRAVSVCHLLGIDLASLAGKLFMASLIELADKALVRARTFDRLAATELLGVIRQAIEDHGLKFLVLDNAGHFYGADENVRAHVVTFLGLLNKLALETGCAIVLISHPNKSGSTYSGVTAWQNQIRVQAHLSKPPNEPDSNVRELRLEKANYAPPGPGIRMLWHHGAFTLESDVPADDTSRTSATQLRQNEIFYRCLATATGREQAVSDAKQASNYAPKHFARMREAEGMSAIDFERTMERLFSAGMIERGELSFNRNSSRNKAHGLRLTGRMEADDAAPM